MMAWPTRVEMGMLASSRLSFEIARIVPNLQTPTTSVSSLRSVSGSACISATQSPPSGAACGNATFPDDVGSGVIAFGEGRTGEDGHPDLSEDFGRERRGVEGRRLDRADRGSSPAM